MNNENYSNHLFSIPGYIPGSKVEIHLAPNPEQTKNIEKKIHEEIASARKKETWKTIKNILIGGFIAVPILMGVFFGTLPQARNNIDSPFAISSEYRKEGTLQINRFKIEGYIRSSAKTNLESGVTFVENEELGSKNEAYKEKLDSLAKNPLSQAFIQGIKNANNKLYVTVEDDMPVNGYNIKLEKGFSMLAKQQDRQFIGINSRLLENKENLAMPVWQNELAEAYLSSIGHGEIMGTRDFQVAHLAINSFSQDLFNQDLINNKKPLASYQIEDIIEKLNGSIQSSYQNKFYLKDQNLTENQRDSFKQIFSNLSDKYVKHDANYTFLEQVKVDINSNGNVYFTQVKK